MGTVREASVAVLRAHGLTTIFGNPGSTELPFLADLPPDFRYVLGLQEAVVAGLADGYSLATGRTVLVNLHTGPGLGNAMGAILGAAANRTPMVVTAGQQVRAMLAMEALLTNVDGPALARPACKWAYEPPRAQDVPAALARAIHAARSAPAGPVFVSLPMDDFDVELTERELAEAEVLAARAVTQRAAPDPEILPMFARRLAEASSPVLVAGSDVDSAGAWVAAVALAERCAMPVWAAPCDGRAGFPQDHPQFRGFLPPLIPGLAQQLAGHDLIVVAGAPVFRYYPYLPGSYLPEGAELLHLTADPAEAARAPAGDALVADIRLALEALAKESGTADRPVPRPRTAPAAPAPGTAGEVFAALAGVAGDDVIWFNESPSNLAEFQDQVRISRPGSYFFTAGGGLGFGLPGAVGAAIGQDRPVIAVLGDGSAQYAIPALWTAAAERAPVIFVVLTNREYAILKWFGEFEKVGRVPGLDIGGIDIVAIARGYGVPAWKVGSATEAAGRVREALGSRSGPVLIEVSVAGTK
ncbi:benzoylformate decarboxylase [Longispora albida]|uniref:benzoylformate decarboxylase n=1 Tax=Longispora albida TaxID=203523 RepID=UPI000370AB86|nr:benzoylformate decarboxylase [Longispora albida]